MNLGFYSTARVIDIILEGQWAPFLGKTSPRLGCAILRRPYDDITSLRSVGKKPSQEAVAFLSETILPLCQVPPSTAPVKVKFGKKGSDACQRAERFFGQCLKQIETGEYHGQPRISVYHGPDGTPFALRKSTDESTALTLIPVASHGLEVAPAGTIVALGDKMNKKRTGEEELPGFRLETYLVDKALTLSPVRLSPWAYDNPLDRSLYAISNAWVEEPQYDRIRARIVELYSLSDFRQASRTVMEVCGVSS